MVPFLEELFKKICISAAKHASRIPLLYETLLQLPFLLLKEDYNQHVQFIRWELAFFLPILKRIFIFLQFLSNL